MIGDHCASVTPQGDFPGGHPSSYQPRPTGLNFDEQTGDSLLCKPLLSMSR